MDRYGVIMAGGGGTRFWPLSRKKMPKQFLNLTGKDTLVNETIDRIAGNMPVENIYIVTNAGQAPLMKEVTTGRLQEGRILSEPAARIRQLASVMRLWASGNSMGTALCVSFLPTIM